MSGGFLAWGFLSGGFMCGGFCPGFFCPDTSSLSQGLLGTTMTTFTPISNLFQFCHYRFMIKFFINAFSIQ